VDYRTLDGVATDTKWAEKPCFLSADHARMPHMADFGHLKNSKKDVVTYTFWGVVGEPKLLVRHAGESNKPFFNEKLRRAEHLQKRKAKVNVELIRDNRERDRELFPKYIITGWEDVFDAKGVPVTFSKDDCKSFLDALDDDEFDGLREFCGDAVNFRDIADGASAAGNSPTV